MPCNHFRRRDLITLLGSAAAAWPLATRAQSPAVPVIGYLNSRGPADDAHLLTAFLKGLSQTGFVEGRNVAIEYRWADSHNDRLAPMAADLVRRQVTVIFANGPAIEATKAATTTIPVVFSTGLDPVMFGLVASLNRPGGNLTGVTFLADELGPKRLELMHELVPAARIIAVLINPTYPTAKTQSRDFEAAAHRLGLSLHFLHASTEDELDAAFKAVRQIGAGALLISNDAFFNSRSARLGALAERLAVPTGHHTREFAAAGGLLSYGSSLASSYHLVGGYTGRILKGEKPADLPVVQSTKFDLIINLKTAKALGLTVPLIMQMTADEAIE